MAQVINTNILSLTTQNNLNRSQGVLGTAIERLSSGSRINSAKDDAAGQAIANRFTANVKGLTQAARNANDGISIAQVTEGAVNEINDNLQRIRELTVQAQNGSNSSTDLKSIKEEVDMRLKEIDRISEQTQFNGVKVLSENVTKNFQVGTNDRETISLDLKETNSKTLNLMGFDPAESFQHGSQVTVDSLAKDLQGTADDQTAAKTLAENTLKGLKADIGGATGVPITDAEVYYKKDADGKDDKNNVVIVGKALGKTVYLQGQIKATAATGDKGATPATLEIGTAGKVTELTAVEKKELGAGEALDKLDKALSQIDSQRSYLGAIQNRMQSTINNLNNSVNNLSAARSRIQDADFATEVSNMSRGQILQQAGTAVLAQANQVPQGVLSLLR